jgi:hypothetical protein
MFLAFRVQGGEKAWWWCFFWGGGCRYVVRVRVRDKCFEAGVGGLRHDMCCPEEGCGVTQS